MVNTIPSLHLHVGIVIVCYHLAQSTAVSVLFIVSEINGMALLGSKPSQRPFVLTRRYQTPTCK